MGTRTLERKALGTFVDDEVFSSEEYIEEAPAEQVDLDGQRTLELEQQKEALAQQKEQEKEAKAAARKQRIKMTPNDKPGEGGISKERRKQLKALVKKGKQVVVKKGGRTFRHIDGAKP